MQNRNPWSLSFCKNDLFKFISTAKRSGRIVILNEPYFEMPVPKKEMTLGLAREILGVTPDDSLNDFRKKLKAARKSARQNKSYYMKDEIEMAGDRLLWYGPFEDYSDKDESGKAKIKEIRNAYKNNTVEWQNEYSKKYRIYFEQQYEFSFGEKVFTTMFTIPVAACIIVPFTPLVKLPAKSEFLANLQAILINPEFILAKHNVDNLLAFLGWTLILFVSSCGLKTSLKGYSEIKRIKKLHAKNIIGKEKSVCRKS